MPRATLPNRKGAPAGARLDFLEDEIRRIQRDLANLETGTGLGQIGGGGGGVDRADFRTHDHDGTNSERVSWISLINRPGVPWGGWGRGDISSVATSYGAGRLAGGPGTTVPDTIVPRSGKIVAVGVTTLADIGGVGDKYAVQPYVSGTGTGIIAEITGAVGTQIGAYAEGEYAFSAGDYLGIWDKRTGTLAATASYAYMLIEWD